jgi:formate hydrogenlyase subunit 4
MSLAAAAGTVLETAAGAVLAPLLPGTVQRLKALLQGRTGPSPLQPYRDLRRLWGKTTVSPEGTTAVYRWAPPVVVAAVATALLVLAPTGSEGPGPVGHDVVVLVGLLALARFALAASAWDTASGFALMGAARDLVIAVSVEALLLLCIALAALPAGSTDLRALAAASAGIDIWRTPAHGCGLLAFALVAIAETGRQPVDNPDTHLELTMVHEGPLLEYAGRDLASLQWAAAARHWIVLSLAASLFLPHGGGLAASLACLAGWMLAGVTMLAVVETLVAKMRLLRVPAFLGAGAAIAGIGLASWFLGLTP